MRPSTFETFFRPFLQNGEGMIIAFQALNCGPLWIQRVLPFLQCKGTAWHFIALTEKGFHISKAAWFSFKGRCVSHQFIARDMIQKLEYSSSHMSPRFTIYLHSGEILRFSPLLASQHASSLIFTKDMVSTLLKEGFSF